MEDGDRLRVGGWVPRSGETAAPATLAGPAGGLATGSLSVAADDAAGGPEPWDLLPNPDATADAAARPVGGHLKRNQSGYQGRRRSGGRAGRRAAHVAAGRGGVVAVGGYKRRIVLVVAAVGAVLVGTGALARTLPDRPVAVPVPAATPPEAVTGAPPTEGSQLGFAPSRTVAPPATSPEPAPRQRPPATQPPTTPPADPPTTRSPREPVTLSFEAEGAELSGFVRLFEVAEASRGQVVGMIGSGQASHVRFTDITVDTAGEYELTLHYVSDPTRDGMVAVNGGELTVIECPGLDDWREVGTVSLPVDLVAGVNEIWFGNLSEPAPALDRITVTG